jgi:maltodextrin utilization protein YvdJ
MGGKFWPWYLANKAPLRAHLASFLIGLLTVLVAGLTGTRFWSWYLTNKDNVVPLLAPLASLMTGLLTVIVAGFAAWIALRQAETARLRHEEQTKADLQRRITESFTNAVEQLGSDKL